VANQSINMVHEAELRELKEEPGWIGIYTKVYSGGIHRDVFLCKIGPNGQILVPFRRHLVSADLTGYCFELTDPERS